MRILRKNILKLLWGLRVVFTIPSTYSIYIPGLKQYSIYFLVLFDSCVFFNISPDPCPKLAKNDFNGGEKRVKTEGFEHIPTICFFENPF